MHMGLEVTLSSLILNFLHKQNIHKVYLHYDHGLCTIFPMVYLAQSGLYTLYFRSHNPKQWSHQHQKSGSTNNRINQKIKQEHKTCQLVLLSQSFVSVSVCLFFTSLSCMEKNCLPNRKGNRVKDRRIWQGNCVEDITNQSVELLESKLLIAYRTKPGKSMWVASISF